MSEEDSVTESRQRERGRSPQAASGGAGGLSLKALLDAYERQLIQTALAAAAGHQRRAAASLGVLPTTLHEKMKRLGLVRRASAGGLERPQDDPATAV